MERDTPRPPLLLLVLTNMCTKRRESTSSHPQSGASHLREQSNSHLNDRVAILHISILSMW